jgi:hypothetical protein
MTFKRKALSMPTRVKLLEVGRELELGVTTNMRLDEMMDVVAGTKKRGILEKILDMLARDTLKSVCFAVGISAEGREKELLAPTGSIYVHLDWHAVHCAMVLMEEILGCLPRELTEHDVLMT